MAMKLLIITLVVLFMIEENVARPRHDIVYGISLPKPRDYGVVQMGKEEAMDSLTRNRRDGEQTTTIKSEPDKKLPYDPCYFNAVTCFKNKLADTNP